MSLMTWNHSFSVNVKQFDEQHIKLIDIINELHNAMIAGNAKEILGRIIDELVSYTVDHFSAEEMLMEAYVYQEMVDHKFKHERLVNQVAQLQQQFKEGHVILTLGVMMFLKDWLVKHIQGDDKRFGAHLNEIGVS